jgi:hypothetical protein
MPSDAKVHHLHGLLARRQGRWRDSLKELREAYALDPRNREFVRALRTTLSMVRDYPAAKAICLAQQQVEPDDLGWQTDVVFLIAACPSPAARLTRGWLP